MASAVARLSSPASTPLMMSKTASDPTLENQSNNTATTTGLPFSSVSTDSLGIQGPLSLGASYDTLLGTIFNGQYTQKLSQNIAVSALGEYGLNQYRMNGTAGFQLYSNGLMKFGAEYLSQVLPFSFDSGDINERVGQSAFGFNFQHNLNQSVLQHINFDAYWAKAPNVSLSTLVFTANDGYEYINQRNLAGATSQGLDVGGTLTFTPLTSLDVTLNYDNVYYHTRLTSHENDNKQGMGATLKLSQLLNDRMKLSVDASNRVIYNTYGAEFAYAPSFAQAIGLQMSLFIQRLVSSNDTPNSNTFGLALRFFGDDAGKAPYAVNTSVNNANDKNSTVDIEEWVKVPAVYMDRVMITAEQITTLAAASISSIVPNSGPIGGGNTVIVNGTNFLPTTQVFFNGQPGVVTFISPHQLSVVVPALVLTSGLRATSTAFTQPVDIMITNPDGQSTVFDSGYTYTEADATVTMISPNIGPIAGGTSITITGTNFIGATSVDFDDTTVTGITVNGTGTMITLNTPAHVAGVVDVTIHLPGGAFTEANGFTYADAPTVSGVNPSSGSPDGGTFVEIMGTGFSTATTVQFGSTVLTSNDFTINSDTSITLTSPPGSAGVVDITVTNPGGTSAITSNDQFTYISPPSIDGVSPNSGYTNVNTLVTISGSNFTGATQVYFGTTAANSFSVDDDSSISATSPFGSAGVVDITVVTPGGTSTISSADQFTYVAPPAIIFVSNTTFTGNLGGFSGADTKCNASGSGKPTSGFARDYTYKALLSGNNATTNGVSYYRTDGTTFIATATGGNLVGSNSLINAIQSSSQGVWTGASTNCSNWATNSSGSTGTQGNSSSASSPYWNNGPATCNTQKKLYCVSQ